MKAVAKLRARWSKRERDILAQYPAGSQTKSDGGYLCHILKPTLAELERRGYDITTFRFSIAPSQGNARFDSQLPSTEDPST